MVHPEVEQMVLEYSLEYPTQVQVRASNELKKLGISISAGGIRSVMASSQARNKVAEAQAP